MHAAKRRSSPAVRDITYAGSAGRPVPAYLVLPAGLGPRPAVVFLHWLGPVRTHRTHFLEESVELAAGAAGPICLLPQLRFPFQDKPVGTADDHEQIVRQVEDIRHGVDLLASRDDVDSERIALVGHDYGGMYAVALAARDPRVALLVAVAVDAQFGTWFAEYFLDLPSSARRGYAAWFEASDPVRCIGRLQCPALLQFGGSDTFVPAKVAAEIAAAACADATVVGYPGTGHDMATDDVRRDRKAYLRSMLLS